MLVNNAGILRPAPVAKIRATDLDAMLRVNLYGALFMTQAALPTLLRRPGGSIVNVASLAGRRGVTPLGGYCASKFALVGLTEALRTEVDSDTLHVGLVLPGVVETPMVHAVDQQPRISRPGRRSSTCPPSGSRRRWRSRYACACARCRSRPARRCSKSSAR